METFFHIHKQVKGTEPEYKNGETYTVFKGYNRFWEFYKNYSPSIKMPDGHICGPSRFAHYCYESNSIDRNGLYILSDILKESGMLIRELVFEEIRKNEFPDLPSRQNCIWLTKKGQVEFWYNWLDDKQSEYTIIEMECDGIYHIGNQSFLNSDIDGYNNYQDNARKYWSGELVDRHDNNEIIFIGKVKIKTSYNIEEFTRLIEESPSPSLAQAISPEGTGKTSA
jgi:hypothetical protein